MTRLLQALLALALMLPAVPVDATHLVPRDPQVHLPTVPEEPLLAQDIEPLRDLQAEWLHRLNSTGQGADAGIQAARNGAEAEAQREPLPGEVLLFTDGPESLGVSAIARSLGLSKTVVHRTLSSLVERGFLGLRA